MANILPRPAERAPLLVPTACALAPLLRVPAPVRTERGWTFRITGSPPAWLTQLRLAAGATA